MTVLVVGASGNVGRHVVTGLTAAGIVVRASSRTPDSLVVPDGVDTIGLDLTDPAGFTAALTGVQKVFLYPNADGIVAFLDAARNADVEHIVLLSSASTLRADEDDNPVARWHLGVEQAVIDSGLPWTFVLPGALAVNALWWKHSIMYEGKVQIPYPGSHSAPVHEQDIADVAVSALTTDGHFKARYPLTGPESLSQRDQVELIGSAIGRQIDVKEMPVEQARAFLPEVLLRHLAQAVDNPADVNETVREVTGHPARTFAQWAIDHRTDFSQG